MALKGEKEKLEKEVDACIKHVVGEAHAQNKEEINELLVCYNAQVLKHRDLSWLGDDYSYLLGKAWDSMVDEEKGPDGTDVVDEFALESKYLRSDEPKFLHDAQLALQKEALDSIKESIEEGSGLSEIGPA